MERTVKFISTFLSYLVISTPLLPLLSRSVSSQPVGEPEEATCDAVRRWELTWRPKIIYCSKPLEYDDEAKNIHENRWFVYVHKPEGYSDVLLEHRLSGNLPVHNLTVGVAHRIDSSTISIDDSGAFYLSRTKCSVHENREDCENNGCEWVIIDYPAHMEMCNEKNLVLDFHSPDPNVLLVPVENCTEGVILATILFEEGRFSVSRPGDALADFLELGEKVVIMVHSQATPIPIQASPELLSRFQRDLPTLRSLLPAPEIAEFYAAAAGLKKGALFVLSEDSYNGLRNLIESGYSDVLYFDTFSYFQDGETRYGITISRGDPGLPSRLKENVIGLWEAPTPQEKLAYHRLIGLDLYPEQAVDYFIEVQTGAKPLFQEALYEAWSSGEISTLDPEDLLVKWQRAIDDEQTKGLARSMGVLLKRIDPSGRFIKDVARTNKRWILSPNEGKPNFVSFKSMLDVSEEAVDPTFSFLNQQSLRIEPLLTISGMIIRTNTITNKILDAIDEGDIIKLNSYRAEAVALRNSLPPGDPLRKILDSNIQMADDAIAYNLDKSLLPLRKSVYQVSGMTGKYLSLENIKIMREADRIGSNLCPNPPSCTQGYRPTGEAIDAADEAAGAALSSGRRLASTVQNRFSEVSGESVGLPREQNKAFNLGKKEVAGILLGIGFSFIFSFGPRLKQYGEYHHDNFALVVGNSIQTMGIGLSLGALTYMGYWTIKAALQGAGMLAILGKLATTVAIGVVVSHVVDKIVNLIVCGFWIPDSPLCVCETDPAYESRMFKLDRNVIGKGEELEYVFYGNLFCPPDKYYVNLYVWEDPSMIFHILSEEGTSQELVLRSYGFPLSDCVTLDGRCYECEINLSSFVSEWEEGDYFVTASINDKTGGIIYTHEDDVMRTIRICDEPLDTEAGCECAVDGNQGICDYVGEAGCWMGPNNGCCYEKTTNRATEVSEEACCWNGQATPHDAVSLPNGDDRFLCHNGVYYSCDPDETWSFAVPVDDCRIEGGKVCVFKDGSGYWSDVCPGECGDPECEGLRPGIKRCVGCYNTDLNGDGEVNIIDVAMIAIAFGSEGSENWDPRCDITGPGGKPDGKVNIVDMARFSRAVGSYPGHERWDPACDFNRDELVDENDRSIIERALNSRGDRRYEPGIDVNNDGKINIVDMSMIARKLGTTYGTPCEKSEDCGFCGSGGCAGHWRCVDGYCLDGEHPGYPGYKGCNTFFLSCKEGEGCGGCNDEGECVINPNDGFCESCTVDEECSYDSDGGNSPLKRGTCYTFNCGPRLKDWVRRYTGDPEELDYSEKSCGIVSSVSDLCVNSTHLAEWYPKDRPNSCTYEIHDCEEYGRGYSCEDGVCRA